MDIDGADSNKFQKACYYPFDIFFGKEARFCWELAKSWILFIGGNLRIADSGMKKQRFEEVAIALQGLSKFRQGIALHLPIKG